MTPDTRKAPSSTSPPTDPCPCAHIVEPLVDGELPDHVCIPTMQETVRAAIRGGLVPPSDEWPVRFRGRRLGLVIREWAQETPNETLAKQLADSRNWQREVKSLRASLSEWRDRNPKADIDGWIDGTVWRKGRGAQADPGAGRYLAKRLRRRGLPDTPVTVQHLRAVAAQTASPPLPARGILVTTFVYIRTYRIPASPEPILFIDENPEVSVSGPLELLTGPILDQAKRVVLAHRAWLRRWERHPLSDLTAIRRAQPGSFPVATEKDPDWYSYRAEALRVDPGDLQQKAASHVNGPEGAISDHLKNVYRRVRKRRVDGGLSTPPPRDWTKELRPLLRNILRPSD